jgi:hypothetical protein
MPYFGAIAVSDGLTPAILQKTRTSPYIVAASNSQKMAEDLSILTGKKAFYLPSVHTLSNPQPRNIDPNYDNVCCFGRVFGLKNIMIQAIAALRFSHKRQKKLRFYVNDMADHQGGTELAALRVLFSGQPNAELVLQKWTPKNQFMELLSTMTIGLQCSLNEASNVISTEIVRAGIPVVVSKEIKWAHPDSIADATDSKSITEKMLTAVERADLIELNRESIRRHNESCWSYWKEFLSPEAFVLMLVFNHPMDTGIKSVNNADAEMLRQHGVTVEVKLTNFSSLQIQQLTRAKNYTHIISEASWHPVDVFPPSEISLKSSRIHDQVIRPIISSAVAPNVTLIVRANSNEEFLGFKENAERYEPHTRKILIRAGNNIPAKIPGWEIYDKGSSYTDDINFAIKLAAPDDVMICSSNVRFTSETSLWLKNIASKTPRIGLLSPKVQDGQGVQGHPQLQMHLASNPWSVVISGESLEPLCLFMTRSTYNSLGQITDDDISQQIRNIGLVLAVTPHKTVTRS